MLCEAQKFPCEIRAHPPESYSECQISFNAHYNNDLEEATYIKNKAFDDQYYRDLILRYLRQYGKAKKKDIRELLWDKLPNVYDDNKKNRKISTLLTSLRTKGLITTDSKNQQISNWILVRSSEISNKNP